MEGMLPTWSVRRDQHSIRVRVLATGSEVEILRPSDVIYGGLTFSHDSNYLYYGAEAKNRRPAALYRVAALGGVPRKVLMGLDSPITLAPDGARFAFVREYPGRGESVLLVANEDGTEERRVVIP